MIQRRYYTQYHPIVVLAIVLLPRLIINPVIQHLEEMFTTRIF